MTPEEYKSLAKPTKRGKYKNVILHVDGIRFDSKREGKRWLLLRQLERGGHIKKLQRQVVFPLIVNGQLICKYRADFVYEQHGQRVVEDSKGARTETYRLKAKLMRALLGIEIFET